MYKMRRKKKRKWPIVLLVLFCLSALALGAGYYVLSAYTIKNVYVEGNIHYTQEEIREIVMDGPLGNNSLYLSLKYKKRGIEGIPFVDVMDVSILSPDTIKITVYEKALAGYVAYMDSYMYFDKDGYVVESSKIKTDGVPQITGLQFESCTLGQKLPVEREDIFASIMDLTKLLSKYEPFAGPDILPGLCGDHSVFCGRAGGFGHGEQPGRKTDGAAHLPTGTGRTKGDFTNGKL